MSVGVSSARPSTVLSASISRETVCRRSTLANAERRPDWRNSMVSSRRTRPAAAEGRASSTVRAHVHRAERAPSAGRPAASINGPCVRPPRSAVGSMRASLFALQRRSVPPHAMVSSASARPRTCDRRRAPSAAPSTCCSRLDGEAERAMSSVVRPAVQQARRRVDARRSASELFLLAARLSASSVSCSALRHRSSSTW